MTTAEKNLERQRRQIERERAAGLVRRTVTIPESRNADLKKIVAKWLDENGKSKPSTSGNIHAD